MRGVDDDHVDAGAHEQFDALLGALADADRRADAQLALRVARGGREVGLLGDVLDRHQPAQLEGLVDDQHALEPVAVHQRLAFVDARALGHRDQALARRHDLAHRGVHPCLETQVAPGHDADHLAVVEHREARNAMLRGQGLDLADGGRRADRDRVAQHAALVALDPGHLGGLRRRRQVLVDDADAAFLRDRDRQPRLGDGVHRRRDQRQVQRDAPGQPRGQAGVARQHLRIRRHQQHVVEGERFAEQAHESGSGRKRRL